MTTGPTGELETTVLPHSIKVETPPTVTTYADGATIDFSGMVVKAYLKTGGLWTDTTHPNGVILISELLFPVSTADIDQASRGASSPLNTGNIIQPIEVSGNGQYVYSSGRRIYSISDGCFILEFDGMGAQPVFASKSADAIITRHEMDNYGNYETITYGLNNQYTYNGKTVYCRMSGFAHFGISKIDESYPKFNKTSTTHASLDVLRNACWTMIWGEIAEGEQTIPVQWTRPGDYSTLESSFIITVT